MFFLLLLLLVWTPDGNTSHAGMLSCPYSQILTSGILKFKDIVMLSLVTN